MSIHRVALHPNNHKAIDRKSHMRYGQILKHKFAFLHMTLALNIEVTCEMYWCPTIHMGTCHMG